MAPDTPAYQVIYTYYLTLKYYIFSTFSWGGELFMEIDQVFIFFLGFMVGSVFLSIGCR